jgi:hypothetical protein
MKHVAFGMIWSLNTAENSVRGLQNISHGPTVTKMTTVRNSVVISSKYIIEEDFYTREKFLLEY